MKTKLIPAIVMLVAGLITSIMTFVKHYDIKTMLVALFIALIVFYVVGLVVKAVFDSFELTDEKVVSDEGEVIEKEIEDDGTVAVKKKEVKKATNETPTE